MKKIIVMLTAICLLLAFASCNKDVNMRLQYDLDGEPRTLDPQYASRKNELTVITNTFEGLFTEDDDGNLVNGVISSYSVSEDGLKYTFILKEDLEWSNGYPLTAKDFEFAFKRLFDPNTNSKTAQTLFCIKNSEAVRNGQMPVDSVGVVAVSNTKLTIELEYINSMFKELLTTAPAMPCNEKFFDETKGEYGLEASAIIANGPYEITRWSHNDYIKLLRNNRYYAEDEVKLSNLTLWLETDDDKMYRFKNEKTHAVLFEGDLNESFDNISSLEVSSKKDTTWGVVFNVENKYFNNANLRKALAVCIDRSRYEDNLPDYLEVATYLVPDTINVGEQNFRDFTVKNYGDYGQSLKIETATTYYNNAVVELGIKKLDDIKIIIPQNVYIDNESYFNSLSQLIQRELNLFIGIEVLSQSTFNKSLANGDYALAITNIDCDYNNPLYMLDKFMIDNIDNVSGYSNPVYDSLLATALTQQTDEQAIEFFKRAEEHILSEAVIIPLYYQEDYIVTSNDFNNIKFSEKSGIINFKFTKIS